MTTHSISGSASRHIISISGIEVVATKSLKSIKLSVNDELNGVRWDHVSKQELHATFDPSLHFLESSSIQITLKLNYHRDRWSLQRKVQDIDIDISELVSPDQHGGGETRECKKSYDGVNIIVHFSLGIVPHQKPGLPFDNNSKLPSMTEEVIQICPRFRVLVIGKSGVGKSSVINTAFGTENANVSHGKAGVSDINVEIIPPQNKYFVLHDSQGFEHGEENNLATAKNFIESRNAMPDVKDKIHAIWLCFGIPRAGGRILETGIEEFFRMETQTPIIAVFTKYDLLTCRLDRSHTSTEDTKMAADAFIKETCIEPLERAARMNVPNMAISTQKGYESTVSDLVGLTQALVEAKFPMEPSVVSAIAQRINPSVKIDGCIAVGGMKYWKSLLSSTNFTDRSLEPCLDVIHGDIIVVWNLNDPHMHLRSKEFKALITNLVDDLSQNTASDPRKTISVGMSMASTIAGIVATLGGPAVPIVMPIVGCFVLAKWVYDVYQQSHDTLRRLMAYIIDLTLIMQNVFWIATIYGVPVSCRLVKLAYISYKKSTVMPTVHEEIKQYVKGQTFFDRLNRDNTLGKIVELLHRYRIDAVEMFGLTEDIGVIDFSGKDDESWDIQTKDSYSLQA